MRKLCSDFILLKDSESWLDPANADAAAAFAKAMRNREYGYEALHDAWNWFLIGWNSDEVRRCSNCGGLEHSGACGG